MPSRPVRSNQHGIHERLDEVVERHLVAPWQGSIHPGSRAAYERFLELRDTSVPLVLDSGCGTGGSTALLAERFADAQVVGIDRSAARLKRFAGPPAPNMLLLRARAEDFWRLMHADGVRPARHFLLYPNPWPKAAQLGRRWHGHPVFPVLLALGGRLELRTNWRLYAEEFRRAAEFCGAGPAPVVSFVPESPLSPFERKYAGSGHELYRLGLNLAWD